MLSPFTSARVGALALVIGVSATAVAAAATPLSIRAGVQFPAQGTARDAGGTTQADVGFDYDVGPRGIVPIRASLQLDDTNGSRGDGRINAFGVGIAGRLTTPVYVGAGISLYTVNLRPNLANAPTASATGVGTNLLVGERLVGLPGGTNVNVEASYRAIPSAGGINPSAYGLGLRVQL